MVDPQISTNCLSALDLIYHVLEAGGVGFVDAVIGGSSAAEGLVALVGGFVVFSMGEESGVLDPSRARQRIPLIICI